MKYPTQADLKATLHYNPETGLFTWLRPVRKGISAGDEAGRTTGLGYCLIGLHGQKLLGHRLAWLYMTGALPDQSIDHVDGDRANNRWSNLRVADRHGQARNQGLRRNNKTGKKGVYVSRARFKVVIRAGSKPIHLGVYETADEAAHAYNKAAIKMHGKFARLNPVGVDK